MKIIRLLNHWMAVTERWMLVSITLFMVFGSFFQVMMRALFNSGFTWGDILLRHLVLWIGFIGASLATRQEKHINIDVFTRFVGKKHKKIARIITDSFSIIIALFLARAGWQFVQAEMEYASPLFGNIMPYYFEMIIPIGFVLIAIRFFLNLLDYLLGHVEDIA